MSDVVTSFNDNLNSTLNAIAEGWNGNSPIMEQIKEGEFQKWQPIF